MFNPCWLSKLAATLRLVDLKALDIVQKGKTKEVRITLTGKILL